MTEEILTEEERREMEMLCVKQDEMYMGEIPYNDREMDRLDELHQKDLRIFIARARKNAPSEERLKELYEGREITYFV